MDADNAVPETSYMLIVRETKREGGGGRREEKHKEEDKVRRTYMQE